MQEVMFEVAGSDGTLHEVRFMRDDEGNVTAHCTCLAGEYGNYCKHRIDIIEDRLQSIVGDNKNRAGDIQSWVAQSPLGDALFSVRKLEAEADRIKKELSQAKKVMARLMRG